MAARWAIAFAVATWLALLGNAALRRLARDAATWHDRAFWQGQLRRLGGPVIVAATLVGSVATPFLPRELAVAVVAAVALAIVGLFDERRTFPTWVRFVITAAAGSAVVAGGIETSVLGTEALDAVFTVLWIVLVTTSFRRIDHTDGLAPALAGIAAAGVFVVAANGQQALATICVALAGACVGFLAYNVRPASVVMGQSGAAFLGFLVAVVTVEVTPDASAMGSLAVPVLLLALPVLDFSLSIASRIWHGKPIGRSRRDHLVHRLAGRGWSTGRAVTVLIAAQAALTGLAALAGRDKLAPLLALLLGAVVIAILFAGDQADVRGRGESARRPERRALQIVGGVLIVFALASAVAVIQGVRYARDAQDALEAALDAGRDGDIELAQVKFAEAADGFGSADLWIGGPLGWPARMVPVLAENFRAASDLASGGERVAQAGTELARTSNERLEFSSGFVPVPEVRNITPDIEAAADLVDEVAATVDDLRLPFLIGPVRESVEEASEELEAAAREADNAAVAAELAPAVFGADRPRQYFLAVQNPAELRGTGGIIGNWGILTASGGQVELQDFERTDLLNEDDGDLSDSTRVLHAPEEYLARYSKHAPAQVWQNLNMTPDFPTLGNLVADLYPQSGGSPIDGVIGVDPVGLQSLLTLAGPVTVPNWPEPITAENVIDITLRQAYEVFLDRDERGDFLGDVAEAVWDRALNVDLGSPAHIADVLGDAGRDGHLSLWFRDPREQALAETLGIAGAVPDVQSDSLMVTTQNAAANKVDFYLSRTLGYAVKLRPDDTGEQARVTADVALRLDNGAPSSGAAPAAIGPFDPRFEAGENKSFVSIYSPLGFRNATLDGQAISLDSAHEIGRNVFSDYVSIPSMSSRTLELQLEGTVSLVDGWYVLDLPRQPTLTNDVVAVVVEVSPAWEIVDTAGMERETPRRAVAAIDLDRTQQVRLRLQPA